MRKKRRSSPTGTLPKYQPTNPTAATGRRRRASEPSPRAIGGGSSGRAVAAAAAAAAAAHQPPLPHQSAAFRAWLRSYRDVSAALRKRLGDVEDIGPLVDAAGGLLVLDDFLPPLAANGVSSALASLPELAWAATGAAENAAQNDIEHFFHSTKGLNVTPRQAGEAAAAQVEAARAAAAAAGGEEEEDDDEEDDEDDDEEDGNDGGGARAKRPSRGSSGSSGSGSGSVRRGGGATTADAHHHQNHPQHLPPGLRGLDPPAAAAAAEAAVRLLPPIFRMLSLLSPGALHTFSAARYGPGHCIAPHDDRAYTRVRLLPIGQEEQEQGSGGGGGGSGRGGRDPEAAAATTADGGGEVIECSRTLAVIYYASKQWRPEWGGALVDLEASSSSSSSSSAAAAAAAAETPAAVAAARRAAAAAGAELPPPGSARVLIPKFNRLVVFRVPRYHQVTPVLPRVGGRHRRFSVFGWFLEPGRLYPLFTGGGGVAAAAAGGGAGGGGARAAAGAAGAAAAGGVGARRLKGGGGRRSVDGPAPRGGRVSRASVATTATDDSGGEGWLQPGSN